MTIASTAVTCPFCDQAGRVEAAWLGQPVRCLACGQVLIATGGDLRRTSAATLEAAEQAAAAGDREAALEALKSAMRKDPHWHALHRRAAELLHAQDRFEEGAKFAEAGLLLAPRDGHLYHVAARCLARAGDTARAERFLRKARRLLPLDEAIEEDFQSLELARAKALAASLFREADRAYEQRQYRRAITLFLKCRHFSREHPPELFRRLAECFRSSLFLPTVREQAAPPGPAHAAWAKLMNTALQLFAGKEYEAALETYQRAARLQPGEPAGFHGCGLVLVAMGLDTKFENQYLKKAVDECFLAVLSADPRYDFVKRVCVRPAT